MKDERGYRKSTNYILKPAVIAVVCGVIVIVLLHFTLELLVFDLIGLPVAVLIYLYLPRRCKSCGQTMRYDFERGYVPEGYFCEKDKVYVKSYIHNV